MDLHTDEDMGHLCKMLDLAELPAGTGSTFSSLVPNALAFFKAWMCVPGFGAAVVAFLLPKSKARFPLQKSDERVQSN